MARHQRPAFCFEEGCHSRDQVCDGLNLMDGCDHGQGQTSKMKLLVWIWRFYELPDADALYKATDESSLQASPSLFRFKYSRVNVPNRNIQLNLLLSSQLTQLSTNPSYAFRQTSSKIPKYVPTPPHQKNNGSRTAPGTLHPNCQLSAFGSSVCPAIPLTCWLHFISTSLTTSIRFLPCSRM